MTDILAYMHGLVAAGRVQRIDIGMSNYQDGKWSATAWGVEDGCKFGTHDNPINAIDMAVAALPAAAPVSLVEDEREAA